MENNARRRLMSEYKKLVENPPEGISGQPQDDNLFIWEAFITGLRDTPWQGVFPSGVICLNILDDEWRTDYEAKEILMAVQVLLSNPSTDYPANPSASKLFNNDKQEYERRVQEIVEWTLK